MREPNSEIFQRVLGRPQNEFDWMEDEGRSIRLRNWEQKFANGFKEVEKYLDAVPYVEKGITIKYFDVYVRVVVPSISM